MMLRVAIIGGGIAGLAAAHRVVELKNERCLNIDVTLLEAAPRLGGTIATEKTDGFLVEAGPDSFITEKPWALGLCERETSIPAYEHVLLYHQAHQENSCSESPYRKRQTESS